ncbi:MAG: biopolymer transporter ExbD [Porphyromonas somerae]|uniref:ExbD/TolR family protein n=1 Tax=Porphyromonas somerae TaxID=322095 RepID=UPI0026ED77AF|nr:biopolymer transporter ExbD [Porphyromonas somerae]MDD7557981.1 biopolymer transporter ExbD [Porphyromonas somerae]MDY5815849.1 biopolymer transporter ExbD [Porphyromonas somerae]
MKLKRKSKAMEFFSMASMTDTIFLLLIFFMVSSTLVVPSALKVTLPRSSQQTTPRAITRIVLTSDLQYFVGMEGEEDRAVTFEEVAPYLEMTKQANPDMYVALYADEEVPYREIVKLLNIAVENHYQMVLATRALE